MSMFSTASARLPSAFAVTVAIAYRFSTSRSMAPMPCSAITASSMPARPSRPPWTTGCRVLTRPSIISGKPVTSETSRTASPASRRARAVPPVESSSTPRAARALASSTRPVLSDTDSRARRRGRRSTVIAWEGQRGNRDYTARRQVSPGSRSDDAVVAQLAAQGRAVDAEHGGGAALVAFAVVEHFHEQRDLEFAQGDVVQVLGVAAIQVADVAAHGRGHVLAQGGTCAAGLRLVGVGSVQSGPRYRLAHGARRNPV